VSDKGFGGLVLKLGPSFSTFSIEGDTVSSGAATPLPRLARGIVEQGKRGLEFFVGVPGSVGGAVRQNAGCFGVETRDRLIEAEIVDLTTGDTRLAGAGDLDLAYRHSNVSGTDLVVRAWFAVEGGDESEGLAQIREITRWRRENQPGGTLNAGSVFKNPPGTTAGELIDRLGLKGLGVGEVRVSEKHANFFIAGPSATSADIVALIEVVKDRVAASTGTILEPEIQMVGFDE
jgi:UDP-N-acetylmuramate dehydrogenase